MTPLSVLVLVFALESPAVMTLECLPVLAPAPQVLQWTGTRWEPYAGDPAPLIDHCATRLALPPPLEEGRNPLSGTSCRPPRQTPVS